MFWYFVVGMLAAFGMLSLLWCLYGCFLGRVTGCALVCLCDGSREEALVLRYHQLRGAGLLRCPLLLTGSPLTVREQEILQRRYPGTYFCTIEQLPQLLEMEIDHIA